MTKKVRVGLIGTRGWAVNIHLFQLKSHPAAEILAICGQDATRAKHIAAESGIPQVFTDYRAMFERSGIEAVVICTPDYTHYPITIAALEYGLHVICEKPMASNATQAREMRDKAVAAGVVHMPFFTFRWIPGFQRLKKLVNEGYIGRCLSCEFHFLQGDNLTVAHPYSWHNDAQLSQGNVSDRGSHMFDMARWLVGDVKRVNARLGTSLTFLDQNEAPLQNPVNDDAWVILEFAGGSAGIVHTSWLTYQADRGIQQRIVLYGDQGMLELDNPISFSTNPGTVLQGARCGEGPIRQLPMSDDPQLDALYHKPMLDYSFDVFSREQVGSRLFIDCILSGRQTSPDFTDGLKAQEVIDASIQSHQTGSWVII